MHQLTQEHIKDAHIQKFSCLNFKAGDSIELTVRRLCTAACPKCNLSGNSCCRTYLRAEKSHIGESMLPR